MFTVFVSVLCCALVFVVIKWTYWWRRGVPQHVTWSPFGAISENLLQRKSMAGILEDLYRKYPKEPYFGIYTFLEPVLILRDAELIKEVAVKNADRFLLHKFFSNGDKDVAYSNNLFATQSGKKWKKTRTTLNPAFTTSKLRSVLTLITQCANNWRNSVNIKPGEVQEFNLKADVFSRFTTDVVANFIFGIDSDSIKDRENEFFKRAVDLSDFSGLKLFGVFGYCINRFLVKLLNLNIVSKQNESFFSKILMDVMNMRRNSTLTRPDIINYFIEIQKKNVTSESEDVIITDQDIIGHSLLMVSAGTDTSSSNLNFLAYELARNPEIQARLRAEIKTSLDASPDQQLDYETLSSMTYLDMVMSECLRKWPPLPFTDRSNESPYVIGEGLTLEKGSVLWIPIMSVHRDARYFPEPDTFDPERFAEGNKGSLRRDCYMPFGVGPRACIGARLAILMMKSIIVHILRDFELVPVEKTPNPPELSNRDVFLHPRIPMYVGLKRA